MGGTLYGIAGLWLALGTIVDEGQCVVAEGTTALVPIRGRPWLVSVLCSAVSRVPSSPASAQKGPGTRFELPRWRAAASSPLLLNA